jgi:hypothetical protein
MERDLCARKELRHLVRQIISGKPLSDVPIGQISELRSGLAEAKSKAVSDGQITRLKVIQRILADLTRLERVHERAVRRGSDAPQPKEARPSPSELDSLIEGLINSRDFLNDIATATIPSIIRRLKLQQLPAHLQSCEFENAQETQELIRELEAELRIRSKATDTTVRENVAVKYLEAAETELQAAQEAYGEELDQFESSVAAAVDRVNTENQKELEKFDAEREAPPPAFSMSFSSELQNLKVTEQGLIFAKRFREAGVVHQRICEMTDVELGAIEERRYHSHALRRQRLLTLHSQKVACTIARFETARLVIVQKNERRIDELKQTVTNMERRLGHTAERPRASEADRRASATGRSPWDSRRRKVPHEAAMRVLPEPHWKTALHQRTNETAVGRPAQRANASEAPARRVGNAGDPQEQADEPIAFTQIVDARRSAGAQAKMSLAAFFGEQDELDEFVAGLPPSRKSAQRHNLTK